VGGVPTHEVNSLELEFLFSINFALHVPTDVYERYYAELANHMGVGVPPELLAANTCDCARFVEHIAYDEESQAYTGAWLPSASTRQHENATLHRTPALTPTIAMCRHAVAGGDGG